MREKGKSGIIDAKPAFTIEGEGASKIHKTIKTEEWLDRPDDFMKGELRFKGKGIVELLQYKEKENIAKALQEVASQVPACHIKRLKEIELTNSILAAVDENDKILTYAYGAYDPETKRILLSKFKPSIKGEIIGELSEEEIKEYFAHEIGHHYLREHLDTKVFVEVRKAHLLLGGLEQEEKEFFADMYASYMTDRQFIKNLDDILSARGSLSSLMSVFDKMFE